MLNFSKDNKWAVVLYICVVCNFVTLYLFGHVHVELWDYSMNNILISREEFAMMNRRGVLFFLNSIVTSMIFTKTLIVYNYKNKTVSKNSF